MWPLNAAANSTKYVADKLQVKVALPNIQFCLYVPFDQSTDFVCSKNEKIRLRSVFFFNASERVERKV